MASKRGASVTVRAATARSGTETSIPAARQERTASDRIHMPITFFRYRTVPSTPASLVRLAAADSGVSTGPESSMPSSDHVPDDRYASSGPVSGAPTTADAVSCEPTATSGTPAAGPAVIGPITVPGSTTSGNTRRGSPSRSISSQCQSPVSGSSSAVDDALVRSANSRPVSQ